MSQPASNLPVPATALPEHVGLILDGNRRWAKQASLPLHKAYRIGYEVFVDRARDLLHMGIKTVSAYVFSEENWNRSATEIKIIMELFVAKAKSTADDFNKENIRVVIVGDQERLQPKVVEAIRYIETTTAQNDGGTLALCFNYGGHKEIIAAARQLLESEIPSKDITKDIFEQHLYAPDLPQIDLLIRTSGERRLSGFMLYRAAYAELYFTDTLWPDMQTSDLHAAFEDYADRSRRHGA